MTNRETLAKIRSDEFFTVADNSALDYVANPTVIQTREKEILTETLPPLAHLAEVLHSCARESSRLRSDQAPAYGANVKTGSYRFGLGLLNWFVYLNHNKILTDDEAETFKWLRDLQPDELEGIAVRYMGYEAKEREHLPPSERPVTAESKAVVDEFPTLAAYSAHLEQRLIRRRFDPVTAEAVGYGSLLTLVIIREAMMVEEFSSQFSFTTGLPDPE